VQNVSDTLQDITLTMFQDAHTDTRTNRTKPLCLRPQYIGLRHKKVTTVWKINAAKSVTNQLN